MTFSAREMPSNSVLVPAVVLHEGMVAKAMC
jgi:hypothetical protein